MKNIIISLLISALLVSGGVMSVDASEQNIKKTVILDDAFTSKYESEFTEFNDPNYVGWLGGVNGLRLNYDPLMQNGVINKKTIYVFGGMNYSINSSQFRNVFVRIKDLDTGEVYLSQKLPEDYIDPELKMKFPKDTKISIQLTSPTGGDSRIFRFTFTLDDI